MAKYEVRLKRKEGSPIRIEVNEAVVTFQDGTSFFDAETNGIIRAIVGMMKAEGFERVVAEAT